MMKLQIIKLGMLSTIQDLGRYGFLSQAVPVSGAMDSLAARLANIAVGNDEDSALIEFTYANAAFKAETDLLIAYAGDGALLQADNKVLPADRPVFVPGGTIISLNNNSEGSRTYLAIVGGWDVPLVLGSRSTFLTAEFGGLSGRAFRGGEVLQSCTQMTALSQKLFSSFKSSSVNFPEWAIARQLFTGLDKNIIRVVPANEFTWFGGASILDFLSKPHTLSVNSNRMGYHLEGNKLNRFKIGELLSTAVTPGTIQVTGDGSLVLLMADCQTTGGYPRIAQVAAVDLPLCGQLKPGDNIYFKEISRHDAEMLYLEREDEIRMLKMAISNKFSNVF